MRQMQSGSYWAYREAGAFNQEYEPYDEPACRDCGVSPEDVKDGHIELYDYNADDFVPVAVNAETGCLCRPEDLEPRAGPDLDGLEF